MRNLVVLAVLLFSHSAFAQQNDPAAAAKAAMKKLHWMTGEWRGEGSMAMGPGPRRTSKVHEKLAFRLDGTVMLIEGQGTRSEGGKELVVHNALAVISFNQQKGKYEMKTWLANGQSTDAWIELVGESGFDWGFEFPSMKVRYIMRLNEKGQWTERGESSTDGTKWTEFFNMVLDRQK